MKKLILLLLLSFSIATIAVGNVRVENAVQNNNDLRVRFLGTGSAGWSADNNDSELRRHSSILVEGHILVDFTQSAVDMLPQGVSPDVVVYTHSHGDHYNPSLALRIGVKEVYMSHTWLEKAQSDFERLSQEMHLLMPRIIPLYEGVPVVIGNVTFLPLPANHFVSLQEQPLMYVIEKEGVRLLYATDTAGLTAKAARIAGVDAHDSKANPITAIIMEATMGVEHEEDFRIFVHSTVGDVLRMVHVLQKTNRYTPPVNQPVYITHMYHKLHAPHKELNETLPSPLQAAYDGMEVLFTCPDKQP